MSAANPAENHGQEEAAPEDDFSGSQPQIDLQDLAEEIFRLIKRELSLENERTGR